MNKQTELQSLADAKGLGQIGYRPGGRYPYVLPGWYLAGRPPVWLGYNVNQAKKKLDATPKAES